MKTSSKLLIGFVCVIFLFMNAIMLDIRISGIHKDDYFDKTFAKKIQLEEFSHVLIKDARHLNIETSDSNYIEWRANNDSIEYSINHKIINDTLIIRETDSEADHFSFTIFAKKELQSISVVNSKTQLRRLVADNMTFSIENGEINHFHSNSESTSRIGKLTVIESNSKVYLRNTDIDTLQVDLIESSAYFQNVTPVVGGELKRNSELTLSNVEKISIDKDQSSKLRMY